jgi:hypothetical protein
MTLSPFARDLGERAGKTVTGSFAAYLFEAWLSTLVALTMTERALIWAAGTTVASIVWSLVSRHFGDEPGEPKTASLLKEVVYTGVPSP